MDLKIGVLPSSSAGAAKLDNSRRELLYSNQETYFSRRGAIYQFYL